MSWRVLVIKEKKLDAAHCEMIGRITKSECGHFKVYFELTWPNGEKTKFENPICFDTLELAKEAGADIKKDIEEQAKLIAHGKHPVVKLGSGEDKVAIWFPQNLPQGAPHGQVVH